ncbi:MAG: hypothetical protein HYZ75_18870 [Elusimicrobia bacterium]|nr:hypothetical protein [Elusimicrobiota bacterium]
MKNRGAIMAVLLLAAAQTAWFPAGWLGAEGDDAIYALLSRSLLHGRYGLEVVPGDPPFGQYTPGWPLLLTPAAAVSGDIPLGYQAWAFLWLVVCDLLVFLWARRRSGARAALAVTALFALNPLVLSRAGVVMPELPGLAAALAALFLADRRRAGSGPLVGALAAVGYLVRPALLPLAPACAVALWKGGRRRDAAWAAGLPVLAWAAWRVWASRHGGFSDEGEAAAALAGAGWSAWPAAVLHNLREVPALWGGTLTPAGGPAAAAFGAGALLLALVCLGLVRRFGRRPYDAAGLYLLGSAALHAAWPWWYERYLPPLLPFALLAAWEGVRALGVPGRRAAWGAAALAALPLPIQGPALARGAEAPPLETYAFLRTLPSEGLVAALHFARSAWHTGRPFVPLPQASDPAALARLKVRWVLWERPGDLGSSLGGAFPASRGLAAWEARLLGAGFRTVFESADGERRVYEVVDGTKVTYDRLDTLK